MNKEREEIDTERVYVMGLEAIEVAYSEAHNVLSDLGIGYTGMDVASRINELVKTLTTSDTELSELKVAVRKKYEKAHCIESFDLVKGEWKWRYHIDPALFGGEIIGTGETEFTAWKSVKLREEIGNG